VQRILKQNEFIKKGLLTTGGGGFMQLVLNFFPFKIEENWGSAAKD